MADSPPHDLTDVWGSRSEFSEIAILRKPCVLGALKGRVVIYCL
jgi:hypothetical protein